MTEGHRYYYFTGTLAPGRKGTAQIRVSRTRYGARTSISHKGREIGSIRLRRVGKAKIQGKQVLRSNGIFLDQRYLGKGLALRAMLATLETLKNNWIVPDTNVSPRAVKLYQRLQRSGEVKTAPSARFRSCQRLATWRWSEKGADGSQWHGWYPVGFSRDRKQVHRACKLAYRWAG